MEVDRLLARNEGKTLEFKRDLSSPAGVLRTVSAFANTAGGTIVFGVEDGTRALRGLVDPLRESERLANLVSDGITPQLVVDIEIVAVRQMSLIIAEVYPGPSRPYHLARTSPEQGTYVRVGSTNRRAGAEMLDELRRASSGMGFDEQPLPELDVSDIDLLAANEQFAGTRRLRRGDLRSLGVTRRVGRREVPTVGGVLLFGADRLAHFPDAAVQIGRFAGSDRTELLDMQSIDDLPVPAIDRCLRLALAHSRERFEIRGSRRHSIGFVPETALREAIVNAVVHADYSQRGSRIRIAVFADRVEVENPGLLPFGVTLEDIRSGHSKLRNRVIGRTFHELGLIEQWGTGVRRMIDSCRSAGIAEPSFEEIGVHFRVVLGFAAEAPRERADPEILELLEAQGSMSTAELASAIGRTPKTARTRLQRLVDAGLVVVIGAGPRDPRRRYRLRERG